MPQSGKINSHRSLDVSTSITTYSRGKINSFATIRKKELPHNGCSNILQNIRQEYLPHKEAMKK